MQTDSVTRATEATSRRSTTQTSQAALDRDHVVDEPGSRQRWILLPKEHGAYAELIFPLITALTLGNGTIAQFLLASAAITAFLAHESFLVILGERGNRARTQLRARATGTAALLLAITITEATLGLWRGPAGTLQAALIPLVSAALLVPLLLSHREKTLAGEFLVALIFSSASIPIAFAGDVGLNAATVAGGVWFGIFALQTLCVRTVKTHLKDDVRMNFSVRALVALGLAIVAATLLAVRTEGPWVIPMIAICPAALVGLTCVWLHVHPRHLRTLGWVLVASDLITLALLTVSSG